MPAAAQRQEEIDLFVDVVVTMQGLLASDDAS